MHKRSLVSFLTFGGFLILALTGLILYFTPQGSVANRLNWSFLGLSKHELSNVHVVFSFLWLLCVSCHIYFNYAVLKASFNRKGESGWRHGKEFFLATAILGLTLVGAINNWPPFSFIQDISGQAKSHWAATAENAQNGSYLRNQAQVYRQKDGFGPGSGYGQGGGRGRRLAAD